MSRGDYVRDDNVLDSLFCMALKTAGCVSV